MSFKNSKWKVKDHFKIVQEQIYKKKVLINNKFGFKIIYKKKLIL